ncbi:MAG: TolC family protein [Candidatus Methylumidiphilus sp.]
MPKCLKALLIALPLGFSTAGGAADLIELYDQALASNPTLKTSEYLIDRAKAQQDQALSRLLPQISATGNLSWSDLAQVVPATTTKAQSVDRVSYEGTRGIVQARQALFDLPSYLSLQGAESAVRQSELELQATHMAVAADLVERYFLVLEATDEIAAIQGEKALTEGDMGRIRRMQELQMAPVTDLLEIEAFYQTLLTREIEAENARLVGLEKLRELAGVPVPTVAPLARDELPAVPGQADEWVLEATRKNPNLQAIQFAIDAASKTIASARAQHLPQLALQLSETYADNGGFDNRQLPRYTVGTVGLQLNVPIYSGGGIEAGVRDAVARYQLAIEKRVEKTREIERETRTAFLDAQAGRARIESTGREVAAREKARDAQQRSYELGVSTIVAVLESKKNLLRARFEQASARYHYIRSLAALRLWAGSLSRQSLEEANGWLAKGGGK